MKNNRIKHSQTEYTHVSGASAETGAALVITLMVLVLLMGFVALVVSKTSTETIITNNDIMESRAYAASEAALENTTRNFVDLFDTKLNPTQNEIDQVTTDSKKPDGFDDYLFDNEIQKNSESKPVVLTGGKYGGLSAIRDSWKINTLATHLSTDVKVGVNRRFYSDRIPLFQFGAFYDDDLELGKPRLFTFGGRVHTNGNLWLSAGSPGVYFNSKVTAVGEIANDVRKHGPLVSTQDTVFVNDLLGIPQELLTGEASVICVNPPGPNVFTDPNLPFCSKNPSWDAQKAKFQGNLESNVAPIKLPLGNIGADLREVVKRGTPTDSSILIRERFANKAGLRISLSDAQNKLPGCEDLSVQPCGVQLDGPLGSSIGYQPLPMADGYKTTALNATRMAVDGREVWIKIETVSVAAAGSLPQTVDVTEDILSLGVTDRAPLGLIENYDIPSIKRPDSRSVIKLQRFTLDGPAIPNDGIKSYISSYGSRNYVVRYKDVLNPDLSTGCIPDPDPAIPSCREVDHFAPSYTDSNPSTNATKEKEDAVHLKLANVDGTGFNSAIVPFPIQMYDAREGRPNDNWSEANTLFGATTVPANGVMSMVDIDVKNLRKFLMGDHDGNLPVSSPYAISKGSSLKSTGIPENAGWVLYISDRRGDYDFDGEYDMEDIFPDGVKQFNEDVNHDGMLNTDFLKEAPKYTEAVPSGQAATADHLYYRRGVRLINGVQLPGNYDTVVPENTRGFTLASENGVYVKGNYNVKSVTVSATNAVTPAENYFPHDDPLHIPAAIVGDAVTILSNRWNDANSFARPLWSNSRVASPTAVRFAMIAGDPITGSDSILYSPSVFGQSNLGIHNLKRFLEYWTFKRLNYSGSLVNLFNSQNNNGYPKCCDTVYKAPTRDWTFDNSFLDINRLPPGTPYIYSISFTGFERAGD